MTVSFDEIEVGQVFHSGPVTVEARTLEAFVSDFAPAWEASQGVPDAMLFALWSQIAAGAPEGEGAKRLGVDALRWLRNPPAGVALRGRMTVMAKDPVGDTKGIVIAQHDLLDDEGRLVFSCLTRDLYRR